MVRQSAKRMRIPEILDIEELVALFEELSHRERVMCCSTRDWTSPWGTDGAEVEGRLF